MSRGPRNNSSKFVKSNFLMLIGEKSLIKSKTLTWNFSAVIEDTRLKLPRKESYGEGECEGGTFRWCKWTGRGVTVMLP